MTPEEVAAYWELNADAWTRLSRAGYDVYRDALNTPAFLALLPPVAGREGLDVGCGEGANTRELARRGAIMHGVDIAPTFVRHAQDEESRRPLGIDYRVGDAQALDYPAARFDFVTAFMCLMDVPDAGRALAEARRVLRPGGFLQFSILHPCFVPPHRKVLRENGVARAIEVAGYFDAGDGQIDTWLFSGVPAAERAGLAPFQIPRFHRTLGQWVALIRQAGFVLDQLGEPQASPEDAAREPIIADTRIVPLFLHLRCVPA